MIKRRCTWVPSDKQDYIDYHDKEWGKPVHDDRLLFEMLILEGAQAGLSWYTILTKRDGYRKAFKNFDVAKVSKMKDSELEAILQNGNIVRNTLKVYSTRKNASAFLAIQKEFGTFDAYLWSFVKNKTIQTKSSKDIESAKVAADNLSKDLKKRGMNFVGGSIAYAYMQAVGLINDHTKGCFLSTQK